MKKYLLIFVVILFLISACARRNIKPPVVVKAVEVKQCKNAEAKAMERNALEYFKTGGFYQASKYFNDAAEIYIVTEGCKAEEMLALVAAAKTHLWAGDKQEFKKVVEKVKGLLPKNEIPPSDIRLLINISDEMERRPLTYPVLPMHNDIFLE